MLLTFGTGTKALHNVMARWAQTAHQMYECAEVVPNGKRTAPSVKAYESGLVTRLDLRFVDIPDSPVRLPADFWHRAILSEHMT